MPITQTNLQEQLRIEANKKGISMKEIARRSDGQLTYDTVRRFFLGDCDTVTGKYELMAHALGMIPVLVKHKGKHLGRNKNV
tara:strand:- start:584 stop:829 length:246 start_codon:yes stop_codon:yes gene_type:complete